MQVMFNMITNMVLKEYNNKQKAFCNQGGLPLFAPNDGICRSCNKNIYDDKRTRERAGELHVTKCPHCNKNF